VQKKARILLRERVNWNGCGVRYIEADRKNSLAGARTAASIFRNWDCTKAQSLQTAGWALTFNSIGNRLL